ncbi:MAG: hypothetical protein R3E96_15100 [Planctomycetota bacterium]
MKSYAILRTSRSLPTGEALAHVSSLRSASARGFVSTCPSPRWTGSWIHLQKG